jgi:pimeloyl-ACP methyl ester carboxylesterase
MTERGPRARLVEFPGVGHAPMLVQPDQVRAVREFLLKV